ncbi:uncharacterized protein LACBIDRAFT_305296 [Laccaria bicolor S238N-H82]|uniref:Predicted protein n=1 Tax=Laccaria bicolor (strain S238N-H82 / ATCC MYA-4686) TaxID=486041 RepID=B0CTW6_LACBS|nr:uncharacterized protein LACBIDRAFT_305296 [Laccaria bicolor S238N-H82]EDR13985.1 predicted protein [Laccaria bicolor S238N-H82]|eukprot:XP_001874544.1 predicted protein [Laccaria bicolor S238N-H82]
MQSNDETEGKGKRSGKKSKLSEITTSVVDLPKGWKEKLLALGPDSLAKVLAELANDGQITASQIKKARQNLPSFSSAKWTELAPQFDLSPDLSHIIFDSFSIPSVFLPPSFHETTAEAAWRIQDVYQERPLQVREQVRVRALDAYLIPIVALFHGRIINRPEDPITTAYSSGGEVEHELVMIGGMLFFVILRFRGEDDIAQLFLELLSAAEMNKNVEFEGLRVYGLLTDMETFHFYSYDQTQKKFAFDEMLRVNSTREMFIADMISVTNKVFTVILFAYTEGLAAIVKKSRERRPVSPIGSSPTEQLFGIHTDDNVSQKETHCAHDSKSTEQWEMAFALVAQCVNKFKEPVRTIEDVEKKSCEAVALLTKSVLSIPRVSDYSGEADLSNENELRTLARRVVREKYMKEVERHIRATDAA